MGQLVNFLYQQQYKDAKLAARLTQLELSNLMAYLHTLAQVEANGQTTEKTLINKTGQIEQLLEYLNQPQALAEVVRLRQQAYQHLGGWSHANFVHEGINIERLLQQGTLQQAKKDAYALLQQSLQAGEQAYAQAKYDMAMAHWLLGKVLKIGGLSTQALPYLQEAQQRFEALGEKGANMASAALGEQGDCLQTLGQIDAAAAVYSEAIRRDEQRKDMRGVAVGKINLSDIYIDQKRYAAALQGYREALQLFTQLDEPSSVATVWHQIGVAHRQSGDYPQAEQAYRQSLTIKSQIGNHSGEANSLNELGNLYVEWMLPEQAVSFYRQAADLYAQLGNQLNEGFARQGLAVSLTELKSYDEALLELQRAVVCHQAFSHAAKPWKTWNILRNLEQARGNAVAAQLAQQQARQTYLAYRRDGGENYDVGGRLCLALKRALQQGKAEEIGTQIEQYLQTPEMAEHKNLLHKLQAILTGVRDLALSEDESLDYDDAAELFLLLEKLREGGI